MGKAMRLRRHLTPIPAHPSRSALIVSRRFAVRITGVCLRRGLESASGIYGAELDGGGGGNGSSR